MFNIPNPFKKTPKVDMEHEWIISLIVAMARLGFIKPEVLARELKNFGKNKDYLLKLINGK